MPAHINPQTTPSSPAHIPAVSIGMPVYNGARFIQEALDSVLAQTYADFELIISDNASTDGTEAICRKYASKDTRVTYIRQPANAGSCSNFNYVLEHARGTYFTWLAHDDCLDPSFLDVMVRYLNEHADVVLCSGDVRVVEDGDVLRTIRLEMLRDHEDWARARSNLFTYSVDLTILIYGVYRLSVMRTHQIQVQSGWMGMLLGLEYSILPRMALQGRVVALPRILRTYRREDSGAARREVLHTGALLRFLNMMYVILRYQTCTVLFGQLTIRQKMSIFSKMCSYDLPVIVRTLMECVPGQCRWLRSIVKWLRARRGQALR
jgi:glycosyltransferase involved in cell wall biosynthesis